MRVNPPKCSFGVQLGKFISYILTRRDIKANPNKWKVFIEMRSPTSVKYVQQVIAYLVSSPMQATKDSRRKLAAPKACVRNYPMRYYGHATPCHNPIPRKPHVPWSIGQTKYYHLRSRHRHGDVPISMKRQTRNI